MKKLFAVVAVLSLVGAFAANADLINGGFEVGQDGQQDTIDGWSGTHGGNWNAGNAAIRNWRTHSGTNEGTIYSWGVGGGDGGWWQELTNTAAGTVWKASAWIWNDSTEPNTYTNLETQLKIEFYNGNYGTALDTVTLNVTLPGETWTEFSVIATSPADTAWARWVIAANDQGPNGALQFDDASLQDLGVIPEPVSAAMFGLGMIAFYALRRRIAK